MALVVGLTGGIATGKSTVAHFLAGLGATVIDADAIVHELQAPGAPLLDEIADAFGAGIIDSDGALDRRALADIVFRDPDARARLAAIVHPKVGEVMNERAARAQAAGAPLIVLDIPLLFEGRETQSRSASAQSLDVTVLVYAPERMQIERQIQRDGCDRDEALRRIRAQLPIEDKKALADVVLDNSGSIDDTERQAREFYERFTAAGA
jgi:dephospho-CoA kinase